MRIKEIEARLAAIKQDIEARGESMTAEEINALEQETTQLTEERAGLIAAAEKRNGILDNIAKGAGIVSRSFQQNNGDDNAAPDDPFGTPEYRSAWLKNIRRLPLNDAEKRAFSNASGAGAEVIPTQTANEIISKVKTLAPMLNEVTLLHVKGAVKFAIEGTNNAAAIHTENASITAAADTLTTVSLSGYEIVKLVQISDTVMTMSITAFESWIVNMLAEAIARKVEDLLINGTGSSQPKGIDNANTWGATNSVTVAKTGALTAANVQTLIGLLPSGYDRNGKFVMNKKTLFTDFMPLQDNSKNHIVTVQNNAYFVYGYPVLLSDYVADHEAFLGDFKKVCANLAENIGVKSAYDIDTNSYKYSGTAGNAAGNAPCIFSQEFDNIVEQEYTNSVENLKTTAYIGGEEKEGVARKVAEVGGSAAGLSRDEVFINATDIVQEYENESGQTVTLTTAQYLALLSARGVEELEQYAETLAFGSKINTNANLKYGTDYDLGDRVTCINKRWNVRIDVRITEIAETYETSGEEIDITFGESLPALLTQIRQITK